MEMWRCRNVQMLSYYIEMSKCQDVEMSKEVKNVGPER